MMYCILGGMRMDDYHRFIDYHCFSCHWVILPIIVTTINLVIITIPYCGWKKSCTTEFGWLETLQIMGCLPPFATGASDFATIHSCTFTSFSYGGFRIHGGTPVHHPFQIGIFPYTPMHFGYPLVISHSYGSHGP